MSSNPDTTTASWRTVTVRVPPEDPRFPDGWWVHTETGECVNGALEISGRPRVPADLGSVLADLTAKDRDTPDGP